MVRLLLALMISFWFSITAKASSADFDIRLAHGTVREKLAQQQLERLLNTYDVRPFTFTYSVKIDQEAGPHSHPVLTLNDFFIDDDASALSTFIHEQYHWYGLFFEANVNAAVEDLKAIYPDMPKNGRGGGRSAHETFVHLIVGSQEYHAVASLFGQTEARRVITGKTWYHWIYGQVLENEAAIETILQRRGLLSR